MPTAAAAPLDADSAVRLLAEHGVVADPGTATAAELAGGVSSTVILVEAGPTRVVVKQALPRLKVADEWPAKQDRLLTEAAALRLAGEVVPGAVPGVVLVVPERHAIAIDAAPPRWKPWKESLLAGFADPAVAARLGGALARWHRATWGDPAVSSSFDDLEAFEQLRVDPYYRTVARRVPDVAGPIADLVDAMAATAECLVHGDFSPKNVLIGGDRDDDAEGCWVLDWEVAHVGDPAFDVAFLTNHLLLKAIRAGSAEPYGVAAEAFLAAYGKVDADRFAAHLGALLLSRVWGKSPVDYLDDAGRARACDLGRWLLVDGATADDAWATL